MALTQTFLLQLIEGGAALLLLGAIIWLGTRSIREDESGS